MAPGIEVQLGNVRNAAQEVERFFESLRYSSGGINKATRSLSLAVALREFRL
ncbi:MAG: hypothetical protein KatS3mg040_0594 [Candidatus Kapaibacterium sp.]|nr:MAG: hypothetical protein KatS3mg040_0594 [Candidatus Kapabacteria bacterium]